MSDQDLLLAATAEIEGLTLWHYHVDFDVIAEVTGQAAEWERHAWLDLLGRFVNLNKPAKDSKKPGW